MRGAVLISFFFFQAEDGIRDLYVTGVQTCALRSRGLQAAVCAAAAILLAVLATDIDWTRWPEIAFFTALTVLAFRLRVRYAGNFVGLEAAAMIPAILVLNSPGAAILICVVADAIAKFLARSRRLTLSNAFDLAQLALSY